MPLVVKDRVRETTTTLGTGTITLAGAVAGFQSFSAIGNANTTYYTINLPGANEWEVGIGTYTASGTTLSRDTVLASSNGGSLVSFSAGTKDVFCTYPAGRSVYYDTSTNVTLNALTLSGGTANGVVYLNASKVATSGSTLTFDGTKLGVNGGVIADNNLVAQVNSPTSSAKFIGFNRNGDYGLIIGYDFASVDYASIRTVFDYPIVFSVNNTEQARLTSTGLEVKQSQLIGYSSFAGIGSNGLAVLGNVGIGTSSPSAKLQLNGDSGAILQAASANAQIPITFKASYGDSASAIVGGDFTNDFSGYLAFQTRVQYGALTERARITSTGTLNIVGAGTAGSTQAISFNGSTPVDTLVTTSGGNVGIGTNSPAAKVDVSQSQNGQTYVQLTNSNAGASAEATFIANNGTYIGSFGVAGASKSAFGAILASDAYVFSNANVANTGITLMANSANGVIKFATGGSAEKMRLDASGNLGIGTSSPGWKLDVIQDSNSFIGARFRNNDSGSSAYAGVIVNASGNSWAMRMGSTAANSNALQFVVDAVGTPTPRMTLDTSGNLGLGVAPSAWGAGIKALQIGTGASLINAGVSGDAYLGQNVYYNGTNNIYINTQAAGQYAITTGNHKWFTAPSGTAGNAISFTQAMTLDASGRLLIGLTSNVASGAVQALINGTGTSYLTNPAVFSALSNVAGREIPMIFAFDGSNSGLISFLSGNMAFFTQTVERARITSSGTFQTTLDASIYGVTVGRGGGAVATNTVVGASALAANTTGASNTALGRETLTSNTTGNYNLAVGGRDDGAWTPLYSNTTGSYNVAVGNAALSRNTTANYNTAIGYQAGYNNTTGSYNTMVGALAGYANTTGQISAFGIQSLKANTTGIYNTGIGDNALSLNTTGNSNTAVGTQALYNTTTASNNTAVGYQSGYSNTTGTGNTFSGYQSAYYNTTGDGNSVFGFYALGNNTTGSYNVAIGRQALVSNTTASNNTAVGYQAGYSNTTGTITAVGSYALLTNTTGADNTAVGYSALRDTSTGSNNSAFGSFSLVQATTGVSNSAYGFSTLWANTTGSYNTAIGQEALRLNTTASYNTAVGYQAGFSNTTGGIVAVGYQAGYSNSTGNNVTVIGNSAGLYATASYNTAVGTSALQGSSGASTGGYNTGVGSDALRSNTTAEHNTSLGYAAGYNTNTGGANTAIGSNSLFNNTTGIANSAVGYAALFTNSTGNYNTAQGFGALYYTTTTNNTAVGAYAGFTNATGAGNTFIGRNAGYTSNSSFNTAVGYNAGYSLTTGAKNNFFGGDNNLTGAAGNAITTGSANTILGSYNGNQGGLDIRTASNYIVLSDGDGNPRVYISSDRMFAPVMNSNAGTNTVKFDTTTKEISYDTSSARYKDNIRDSQYGLADVMKLRSAMFEYKNNGRTDVGLIAEEVDEIIPELVPKDLNGRPDAVSYDRMVSVLVKAIQELKAEFDAYKATHP